MHSPAIRRLVAPSWRVSITALAIAALCSACNGRTPVEGALPADRIRVLFIGNSLTYSNDMPSMVETLGDAGGTPISTHSATLGGTALVDHLTTGPALADIARSDWEVVVMQQGPTPAGLCRDTLILATRAFAPRIRAAHGTPATLMPWPPSNRQNEFAAVRESALAASEAVQGLMLPAGEAWLVAWRTDPTLPFYSNDGFHPSPLGSLLVAMVVYEGVTGRDVRALPAIGLPGTPEATIRLLQRAAHEAMAAAGPVVPRSMGRTLPALNFPVPVIPTARMITC